MCTTENIFKYILQIFVLYVTYNRVYRTSAKTFYAKTLAELSWNISSRIVHDLKIGNVYK